ncbi:MAG: HD domain-containing protein [Polyangiaceae bacterium]
MMLGPRFTEALGLANELHSGQTRKASKVPYLSHVLSVAATVLEYGGDEDVAIAALLHTTSLKTAAAWQRPCSSGADMASASRRSSLGAATRRNLPSRRGKSERSATLAHLPEASPEVLLVSAADKLHNLQSLLKKKSAEWGLHFGLLRAGRVRHPLVLPTVATGVSTRGSPRRTRGINSSPWWRTYEPESKHNGRFPATSGSCSGPGCTLRIQKLNSG